MQRLQVQHPVAQHRVLIDESPDLLDEAIHLQGEMIVEPSADFVHIRLPAFLECPELSVHLSAEIHNCCCNFFGGFQGYSPSPLPLYS